jgi:LuxR family transcriptional regulator, maltose regulon positive regulatory protein
MHSVGGSPMAEPPATTSFEVAASERDSLLATKLYVPRTHSGFVRRPRLLAQLDAGSVRPLSLVCAPAGFGKTALLADWIQARQRSVAWLSLDSGDNDPARFWRYAAAALDRVRPGIADGVARLLSPPAPPSFEGVAAALINELTVRPGEHDVLLVLDDYHAVEAQPVHQSLMFLLDHLPSDVHVILAGRADPPLPLARLRARGQLAELRAADLRFSPEEAAALLREAIGRHLSEADVAALTTRTEGWAAGLQLAALSLAGQADVAGFVATFSGSHRYVLDYLTEEVLELQTERVRGFLLETSVLNRLSGELCDAVTGRTDGQAMLEALERANLFLVPLDEVRGWWRYHQLFADLLRARLQRQDPERAVQLHRNAAAWHDKHGLADEAVRHALDAGDPAWAARLMERHIDALHMRSEGETLQRWRSALPTDLVASRPRLLLADGRMALLTGRVDAVEASVDAAERAWAAALGAADEEYTPSVGRGASGFANVPAAIALERAYLSEFRGDAEGSLAFASRVLAELDEGEWMLESLAQERMAVADWLRGKLPEAEDAIALRVSRFLAAGESTLVAWECYYLGLIQRAQGRLDAARRTYQHVLEITSPPGRPPVPASGAAFVGLAELAYQRGELDAAARHLREGMLPCRQLTYTQPLATGLATLAWIRQAEGDRTGALDTMREAERVAPSAEVTALLNPVPVLRARLLLAHSDLAAAIGWIEERGLGADDQPSYAREPEYLVLARVLLARNAADRALVLLQRLYAAAVAQSRVGSIIEIQALRSLALAADGDETGAVAALADALSLAHGEGYIRVFADEGHPMSALLGRVIAAQRSDETIARDVPLDYVARLLKATGEHGLTRPETGGAAIAPGLVEPLTARELEVLGLLAAGRSNRDIAADLVVTLDTVKKHVSRILSKLGAVNRTEAVARGRGLGLIT